MAYAYYNQHCYHCNCKITKGDPIDTLWANGIIQSFCKPCGTVRKENRKKAAKKRANQKNHLSLFD